jgi:spore coat polysaccharide biosynthesis predicted glycosyltransferase SpsG
MIAICIEASHARGLGHLYKALNLAALLREKNHPFVILLNQDPKAARILEKHQLNFHTVSLSDIHSNWEAEQIGRLGISLWLNDRLDTQIEHSRHVKDQGVRLVTVDDRGAGAELADLHFAPLLFSGADQLKGKRVLTGHHYLILNREIERYQRVRREIRSIVVSLGGSDTYGVTLKIVNILKQAGREATIVTGPSFCHDQELLAMTAGSGFLIKSGVPSLIEEFSRHDLAVTGGGVTPFEANAAGLPCVIVANEVHEIEIGRHLANLGSSRFAGYHDAIDHAAFSLDLDLEGMSRAGLSRITTQGAQNVYRELQTDG